jgi:hypothetical protein
VYRFPVYSIHITPGAGVSPLTLFWVFYRDSSLDEIRKHQPRLSNPSTFEERMAAIDWLNQSGKPWHLEYDARYVATGAVVSTSCFSRKPAKPVSREQRVTYFFVLYSKEDATLFKLFTGWIEEPQ